jgi:hypothetical protein
MKIEAQHQHMPILFATLCQYRYARNIKGSTRHGQPPPQHTCGSPFSHFPDLQQEHPRQVDLLVGKNNVGETVTAHKQPPGVPKKLVSKMLTKCLLIELYLSSIPGNQPVSPKKLASIFARYYDPTSTRGIPS